MNLPFTLEQFLQVFRAYNHALQPLQLYIYLLMLTVLFLYVSANKSAVKITYAFLSLVWFINGLGYHILFFSKINPLARVFGVLFIMQAVLFLIQIFSAEPFSRTGKFNTRQVLGWFIILYAVLIYNVIGFFLGHAYPTAPVFGIAPCPTAIFTLGMLLVLDTHAKKYLFIIPLLWSVIGSMAAFQLGIREDLGLLVSALVSLYFLFCTKPVIE